MQANLERSSQLINSHMKEASSSSSGPKQRAWTNQAPLAPAAPMKIKTSQKASAGSAPRQCPDGPKSRSSTCRVCQGVAPDQFDHHACTGCGTHSEKSEVLTAALLRFRYGKCDCTERVQSKYMSTSMLRRINSACAAGQGVRQLDSQSRHAPCTPGNTAPI